MEDACGGCGCGDHGGHGGHEGETVSVSLNKPVGTSVSLTRAAADKLVALMKSNDAEGAALRFGVSAGGCSGYMYDLSFDKTSSNEDTVFENHGVRVLVSKPDLQLVGGTEIDYVESLQQSGFKIKNPNAKSSCACGKSEAL